MNNETVMSSFVCRLFLLSLIITPRVASHALWQQVVHSEIKAESQPSFTTVFTFSEKPGLENAPAEKFATMVLDKGLYAYVQGCDDDYYPLIQIYPRKGGRFLVAELPANLGNSYALEGFSAWGLYDDHYSVFYTSAPNYGGDANSVESVTKASKRTNKLRVDLIPIEMALGHDTNMFYDKECKGTNNICIAAQTFFEGQKLTDKTINIINGDTGENIDSKNTNIETGMAYFSLPKAIASRVYAKVTNAVDIPGVTRDGQHFNTTSYHATTVLEVTPNNYAEYPANASTTTSVSTAVMTEVVEEAIESITGKKSIASFSSPTNEESSTEEEIIGYGALFAMILVASVMGGVAAAAVGTRFFRHSYDVLG